MSFGAGLACGWEGGSVPDTGSWTFRSDARYDHWSREDRGFVCTCVWWCAGTEGAVRGVEGVLLSWGGGRGAFLPPPSAWGELSQRELGR